MFIGKLGDGAVPKQVLLERRVGFLDHEDAPGLFFLLPLHIMNVELGSVFVFQLILNLVIDQRA